MKFLGQFSTFQKTVQKRPKSLEKKVRPTRGFVLYLVNFGRF